MFPSSIKSEWNKFLKKYSKEVNWANFRFILCKSCFFNIAEMGHADKMTTFMLKAIAANSPIAASLS